MPSDDKVPSKPTASHGVDAFLRQVAARPPTHASGRRGRLLFAMDATASRQPTWDQAAHIQGEMFHSAAGLGGLDIQLAFFRGFGEFRVSAWTDNEAELLRLMTSVGCLAGQTQLGKVLSHARNETKRTPINALVYVGDSFEEDIDSLAKTAGELGLLGVPVFMFHEGGDPLAAFAFQQIAKLTGGAYCPFDGASAEQLKALLGAVAVFAAGGRPALQDLAARQGGAVKQLAHQMKGGG